MSQSNVEAFKTLNANAIDPMKITKVKVNSSSNCGPSCKYSKCPAEEEKCKVCERFITMLKFVELNTKSKTKYDR